MDVDEKYKKFNKLNNDVEKLDKPISASGLKHFGVIEQLIESRKDFTKELIDETPNYLTYLSKNYKSYFKETYKRFVNYVFEEKEQQFYTIPKLGFISSLNIKTQYDYLNKMVLCLKLPELTIKENYKTTIIKNICDNLDIEVDLSTLSDETLLYILKNRIKEKYYEYILDIVILKTIIDNIDNYNFNTNFNYEENMIILFSKFILSNSKFFNVNYDTYNFMLYLINILYNTNIDNNLINISLDIPTYYINNIITSITSNKFKETMKNGYYLLNKNNVLSLIKVSGNEITEENISKFKVFIKNNIYKSNNEFYVIVNSKIYNVKQIKDLILNKMVNNENFKYFKESNNESIINGIYFIQDFLNIKKQYNISKNIKDVELFIESLKFVYSSLKYFRKIADNHFEENIHCDIDFTTFINRFNYKLNDSTLDDIQRVFKVFDFFKQYKFSKLFVNFNYDTYKNNTSLFILKLYNLLSEFIKYKDITTEDIITGNIDNQLFKTSKLEDLLGYLDKHKVLDKQILDFKNELEYQLYSYLKDHYKLSDLDFDTFENKIENMKIDKSIIFDYLKILVISFIPIVSEIKIIDNSKQTLKQTILFILQDKLKSIENKIDQQKDVYTDLQNGNIDSLDYFLKLKYIGDIGHNIFDYMEITIDNQIIEKLGYEYYLIYKQLHLTYEKRKGLDKLINGTNGIVYVPLHFFFNDYIELSLPLLRLRNTEINFNIKFKELNQIIVNHFITPELLTTDKFDNFNFKAFMIMKYVIIDQEITKNIIDKSMKLMINQFQYSKPFLINANTNNIKLSFKNSIKYIIIYLETNKHPFKDIQIYFENHSVTEKIDADYYNLCTKYNSFNVCEYDNLYIINYSLYPESLQPSGSLNYSCFNNIKIYFNFKEQYSDESFIIKAYSLSYNYLNIDKGKCYLEFES